MQHYKSERQRQLDNVQKELLTNYYLQRYNTYMGKDTNQPQNYSSKVNQESRLNQSKSHRLNFKNMILMKKNQNQNIGSRQSKIHQQPQKPKELVHKYSSREQQQNKKIMKKLEDSIINELYKPSPSKIQEGNYKKLQINSVTSRQQNKLATNKIDLQPVPIENIQISYDQEQDMNHSEDDELLFKDNQDRQRIDHIKESIKLSFDRRKDKSLSPRKNSLTKSSKISVEIKIQSPKRLEKSATPNRNKSKNNKFSKQKNKQFNYESSSQDDSEMQKTKRRQINSFQPQKQPQVYFVSETIDFPSGQNQLNNFEQVQQGEQIQFIPPSSNYYKSQNDNLVQQSFKFQEEVRQNRDQDSEKSKSIASSRKSSKQKGLLRNQSKNSIRSRKKSSSKMEMSFVSKMSMLSSEEGFLIKQKIQKELYDNELGPYQSALYNILQLIDKNPRSGPVYAVGQKTLDDRRIFEQRRIAQQSQISNLKKNMQKLKRKSSQIQHLQRQDKLIRNNQLQILRLIRKISTNL